MSVNHVIASIRKETIDSASEKLKFDSTFLEISNNLLVNNDCSLNGGATISNEIIIDGIINVKISNYNFSQNSIEQKIYNPFFPCGSVVSFATKKAPDGWLECDGNAISRIIYANLFNIYAFDMRITCIHTCLHAGMHACMHVCMYACMYLCMYVMYVCM